MDFLVFQLYGGYSLAIDMHTCLLYKLLPYKDSLMSVKHKTTTAAHNMYLHMQPASQFHLEVDPVAF